MPIKKKQTTKYTSFLLFSLLILSLFFIACTKEKEILDKKKPALKVYTSLFAFEHFARILLPDSEIESLVPPGVDPHHFEPSLKDIQKLHNANIVIYIGNTDVDRWIDKIKDELIKKGIKVIRIQDSIQLKNYAFSREIDPHVWLDPIMSLDIVREIKDKAIELSPQQKDIILKNFTNFEKKLRELEISYRETLSNCTLKDIISTHEFLNYPSLRYDFKAHFIVHEPEEEASPKKIKILKDLAKKKSIEYIITEPEGEKIAKTLSQEAGLKVLNFNTYHTKTDKDYISAMKENLKVLATALKCELKNGK